MAFSLNISLLNLNLAYDDIHTQCIINAYNKLSTFLKTTKNNKTGLFFRNDHERKNINIKLNDNNFDISTLLYFHGLDITKQISIRTTELLIHGILPFTNIKTDRLHVSIISSLLNK